MLLINNISSGYGKKQVLFNISLEIKKGDVVLLIGGNGSGKSTLLKCIYNLLPLWEGNIELFGSKTTHLKSSDLIHKGVVYIPQKNFYFENLSVEENLQISGYLLPKTTLTKRISEVFDLTELSKFRKRKPFNLSGGERKILAIGMALIHKPKLLLFDEPYAGIDSKNSEKVNHLFREHIIMKDNIIIIVEHKLEVDLSLTRTINLDSGKIKN